MNPSRLTLDTNCLINLEQSTGQFEAVRALLQAHRSGQIALCVTAMAASENQRGGRRLTNYGEFEAWLKALSLEGLTEIFPMGYFGISFWNHALFSGPEAKSQEDAIHRVLHPEIPVVYGEYCAARGIDPNAKTQDRLIGDN